jgi:hypothetical protein
MMGVEFGGPQARKTGTYKALGYSLQYVNGEPALVLWRLHALNSKFLVSNSVAFVICLSAAHRYRSDTTEHLVTNYPHFIKAVLALGLDGALRSDIRMVIDACEHLLEELVKMKPQPLGAAPDNIETMVADNEFRMVVH